MADPHRIVEKKASPTSQTIAEDLARAITARGWSAPAALLLELMRPLAFVGSQLLLVVEPLAGPSAHGRSVRRYSEWLQNRHNIDLLLQRIETHSQGATSGVSAAEEDRCSFLR